MLLAQAVTLLSRTCVYHPNVPRPVLDPDCLWQASPSKVHCTVSAIYIYGTFLTLTHSLSSSFCTYEPPSLPPASIESRPLRLTVPNLTDPAILSA
jgi:hypothetical protein